MADLANYQTLNRHPDLSKNDDVRFIKKHSWLALLVFIGWIIFLANSGSQSLFFDFVDWLPMGDKLGHAGLFGLLTLLLNIGLGFRPIKSIPKWLSLFPMGSALVSGFVLVEECSQYFIASRTFDGWDLFADFLGILVGTLLSLWLSGKKTETHAD